MGYRDRIAAMRAYRPSVVQKNFATGLGIAAVFGSLMGSGFLLQKNKETIDKLQKDKHIKNKGEGSMNDQLSGISWYSAVLVGIYGVGALIASTKDLQVYLPYIITLVGAVLFIMIGLLGYILIKNQIDINEIDADNSAITNNILGGLYITIAVIGMGSTIYWQFKKQKPMSNLQASELDRVSTNLFKGGK